MTTSTPQPLYREPVQLNAQLHRHKKLNPYNDFSRLANAHAVFLNAVEFAQAALCFPIIFLPASTANPQVSPVAMLGLVPDHNLFVDGSKWDANYLPAFFRRMPYLTAPLPGTDQTAVYIDVQWPGLSDTEGEALFTEDGKQAPILNSAIDFLQVFDEEARRTAHLCARLQTLGLLMDMKADATLPNGATLSVDGFMVVDEAKLAELPDAVVIELNKSGALALIHAHLLSLQHVRSLVDRHARRVGATPVQPS
jgi:hypothetical protein